jgi:hypothetical protein
MKSSCSIVVLALALGAVACASGEDTGDDAAGAGATSSSVGSGGATASSSSSGSPASSGTGAGGAGEGGGPQGGAGGSGGVAPVGGGGAGGSEPSGGAGGGGGTGGGGPSCGLCIDDPNPATRCNGSDVVMAVTIPAGAQWASSVVSVTSEYSTPDWSAAQATGAPNTYPQSGDLVTAWATLMAESPNESITLGFAPAATGSMVWIFLTHHPDAVKTVTVGTQAADTVVYQAPNPTSVGDCAYVLGVPTNTTDPITHVKIDLASELVSGWNEIDAVGVMP